MRLRGGLALWESEVHDEAATEFARFAGLGLAHFAQEDIADNDLSLVFAMSAWLRFAGSGIPDACSGLLRLRETLVEASSLDRVSEPVPLLAREPRTALLGLAKYVHGLISRAARYSEKSPTLLVEEALALLT